MSRYPLHSPQKPSIFVARRLLAPSRSVKIRALLFICLSALMLTACGGGGGEPQNDFTILGNSSFSGGSGSSESAAASVLLLCKTRQQRLKQTCSQANQPPSR